MVSDNQPGLDEKTDSTLVSIIVIRVPPPTWIPNQLVYQRTLDENEAIDTVVIDLEANKADLRVRSLFSQKFVVLFFHDKGLP